MFFNLVLLVSLLVTVAATEDPSFIYNGFLSANLSLDGIAGITSNGLLQLTNDTKKQKGHAFYLNPITFKNSSNGTAFSFSTTFVFGIVSEYATLGGGGTAFVIAPTRGLPGVLPSQFLGLFNETNNGNATNHVVAIELDTALSREFDDINENHVGIDINGLNSLRSAPAGYYNNETGGFRNLTLISGQPLRLWVKYDGVNKQIYVTLAPIDVAKSSRPLLSLSYDLLAIVNNTMYVGFSSPNGFTPRVP